MFQGENGRFALPRIHLGVVWLQAPVSKQIVDELDPDSVVSRLYPILQEKDTMVL